MYHFLSDENESTGWACNYSDCFSKIVQTKTLVIIGILKKV